MERRCMYFARTRAGIDARKRYAERSSAKRDDPVRNFLIAFFHFCARRNRTKYEYDNADRLTREKWLNASFTHDYEYWYDAVGNRTAERQNAGTALYYNYDAANQLLSWNSVPPGSYEYFAYDPRGNCVQIDDSSGLSTYFEYNDLNMVKRIQYTNGVVNRFWYDALGRRCALEDSAGLSYFTWDQNGLNLLAEHDVAGNVTAYYTHGYSVVDGIGSGVAATRITGGGTYFHYDVYDHRGSVIRRVDNNGTVVGYFEYDAWGTPLRNDSIGAVNRFGYQTNWITLRDGALLLSQKRVYKASLGQFLGRDFIECLGGAYKYADGDPVTQVDKDGADNEPAEVRERAGIDTEDRSPEAIREAMRQRAEEARKDAADKIRAERRADLAKAQTEREAAFRPEQYWKEQLENAKRQQQPIKVRSDLMAKYLSSRCPPGFSPVAKSDEPSMRMSQARLTAQEQRVSRPSPDGPVVGSIGMRSPTYVPEKEYVYRDLEYSLRFPSASLLFCRQPRSLMHYCISSSNNTDVREFQETDTEWKEGAYTRFASTATMGRQENVVLAKYDSAYGGESYEYVFSKSTLISYSYRFPSLQSSVLLRPETAEGGVWSWFEPVLPEGWSPPDAQPGTAGPLKSSGTGRMPSLDMFGSPGSYMGTPTVRAP